MFSLVIFGVVTAGRSICLGRLRTRNSTYQYRPTYCMKRSYYDILTATHADVWREVCASEVACNSAFSCLLFAPSPSILMGSIILFNRHMPLCGVMSWPAVHSRGVSLLCRSDEKLTLSACSGRLSTLKQFRRNERSKKANRSEHIVFNT